MVFANLKSPAHFTCGKQKSRMVTIGTQTGQATKTGWNKKALQMSWITCMYQQEMPNISNTLHTKQVQFQTHRRCNLQV